MIYVYVLNSISHNFYYVGMTNNHESRIIRHNKGHVKSTKAIKPFGLFYFEKSGGIMKDTIRKIFLNQFLKRKSPYLFCMKI